MKTTVTKLEDNKVRLAVEVDIEEMGSSLDRAARELSRKVSLKGFRNGKVPRKVLERHIGRETIAQEAIRYAVPEFLADAVVDEGLDIIGHPEIEEVDGGIEGPLTFRAVFDTRPELEFGDLTEVEVRLDTTMEPTDVEVDDEIAGLRRRFATTETVTRPARRGDQVLVNIAAHAAGNDDDKIEELTRSDFLYEVGSSTFIPALDEELVGSSAGDILRLTTSLAEESPVRPGVEASFGVLVKDVKEMKLPELDDDFVSEASEFETVAELRDEIRRTLRLVKASRGRQEAQEKVMAALVMRTGLRVPDLVVAEEVSARLDGAARDLQRQGLTFEQYLQATGTSVEDLREQLRPDAARAVEAALILRAAADEFEVTASEDEVDAEIETLAERTGRPAVKVRRELTQAGQLKTIAGGIIRSKALRHLLESVTVLDASGEPVDVTVSPVEASENVGQDKPEETDEPLAESPAEL